MKNMCSFFLYSWKNEELCSKPGRRRHWRGLEEGEEEEEEAEEAKEAEEAEEESNFG